uniref:GH18 domain-containing protein n=1 Tax=Anopheles christyi TaxID=43041 RepID=A0A182KF61_9DIPT
MDRYLASCLLLLCMVLAYPTEIAAQKSRVCFAQSSDYTNTTALGFCSHAVYMALNPTSKAFVGILNPANDADDLLGGIRKFVNLKKTFTNVEMYMGVLGSVGAGNILWLQQQTMRKTFIDLLVAKMATYPEMSGVYLDFDGLTNTYQNPYALFVAELYAALTAKGLKLTTALPWDASALGDIYYSSTLSSLPFNVIKTHEEMYSTVSSTRPISPLFAMSAPFNVETKTIYNNVFRWVLKGFLTTNIVISLPMYSYKFTVSGATGFGVAAPIPSKETYCSALLFGSQNTIGAPQGGEAFAYNPTTFYTYNSPAALVDKLQFAIATNLAGVAVFSLDQAGSRNAEMLRQVTSVLAPTPASGAYPAAEAPECGIPVTFPAPPTTVAPTTPTPAPTVSTAAGGNTTVAGGNTTVAGGNTTVAGGNTTVAGGNTTVAGGNTTVAGGNTTVAGGNTTVAGGNTTAAGGVTTAPGGNTTVAGGNTTVAGGNTTVAGGNTTAAGGNTTVAGGVTTAPGGNTTVAGGNTTVAGGNTTVAGGNTTVAGGNTTVAGGNTTAAGGDTTVAGGNTTVAGGNTTAAGGVTTAPGGNTTAAGGNTTETRLLLEAIPPLLEVTPPLLEVIPLVAGGNTTVAGGNTTVAGGNTTVAGGNTTAAGGATTASGTNTTVAGGNTTVAGGNTTVAGGNTTAAGGATTAAGGSNSTATTAPSNTSSSTAPSTTPTTGSTTIAPSPATCNLTVKEEYGTLVAEYCVNLKAIAAYVTQGASCGVVV